MKEEIESIMDKKKIKLLEKRGEKYDLASPVGLAEEGDKCLK